MCGSGGDVKPTLFTPGQNALQSPVMPNSILHSKGPMSNTCQALRWDHGVSPFPPFLMFHSWLLTVCCDQC